MLISGSDLKITYIAIMWNGFLSVKVNFDPVDYRDWEGVGMADYILVSP